MTEPQSALLLRRQLAELNKNPVEGFSAGLIDDNDLYRWEVLIIGPPDTLYEGGVFKAHLTFPKDYPLRPPKMKFITEIWHPNVDKNGDVCISILHEPGEDKYGYEKPEERWLPIHTVETIMISVISMLADPNGDSPANVDAAGSPQRIIFLHLSLSSASSTLAPTSFISSLIPSIYLLFGLPLCLLPGSSIKSGGKTDMVNSREKLPVVYERAKRQPLTDIHPAACSITNFRAQAENLKLNVTRYPVEKQHGTVFLHSTTLLPDSS
ncbi:hypothetical protein QTP70_035170 [Hemibagrus guttatus]|uniref:Ubiquitin-conjugating enzyme E2 G1 n=1 Tax=Hemibagrus guttatus TaxID=175788 RepID=A0AAE0PWL1_9TELE|nr:hypothetical protein QTP70_035170 [Hemibagrus guttatus]KAK3527629.1 hypothetical protein QTP86_030474 [Hemibagrus guttatus]